VPSYDLMGGRHRDRIALMYLLGMRQWPRAATVDELLREAAEAVADGFGAVKVDPFLDGVDGFHTQSHARRILQAVEVIASVREAVGWDTDIAVEVHRKLGPAEAVRFADDLHPFRILMYEDSLPPDSIAVLGEVGRQTSVPIGAGERQDSIYRFDELLQTGAAEFIRPDVGTAGGPTNLLKIAALAEARHRRLICHNFLSPFLTAATLQVQAAIPNTGPLEWSPLDELSPRNRLLASPLVREGGYMLVPDGPGTGVEIRDGVDAELGPFRRLEPQGGWRQADGSIHTR
jgi:galactonate dehydratase